MTNRREAKRRQMNRLLLVHFLLPTIFLTVALLGGVRIAGQTQALLFVPPPLVTLILSVLLTGLFARARLIQLTSWLSGDNALVENAAHALTLLALFFASAQAFNTVLPEAGLPRWLFSFFFLWTLWQSQFSPPEARRTLRSLVALFGTAFILKHLLLASLYAPDGGWLRRLAGALVEGLTQGTLGEQQSFAPSTGYISFFTLALYVTGLALLPPAPGAHRRARSLVRDYERLPAEERASVRAALLRGEARQLGAEMMEAREFEVNPTEGDAP